MAQGQSIPSRDYFLYVYYWEQNNLLHNPAFARTKQQMQNRLYAMMDELGAMEIPMNPPRGRQQNNRLRDRNGVTAVDFPEAFIVDKPLRKELR